MTTTINSYASSSALAQDGIDAVTFDTTGITKGGAIQSRGFKFYTLSATLLAADSGRHMYVNAATAQTLTLPDPSTLFAGAIISISNIIGAGAWTITRAGAALIFAFGQTSATSIILNPSDSVQLVTDGANWVQVTGRNALGSGQTWQAVSRSVGTSYTNTTGKPIQILISGTVSSVNGYAALVIGGVNVGYTAQVANASYIVGSVGGIVPNNVSYNIANQVGTFTISTWSELR